MTVRERAAMIFEDRMGFAYTDDYEQSREWSDAVAAAEIEVGDHVTIGSYGTVHWEVTYLHQHFPWAILKSGMTGRHTTRRLSELTVHTKSHPEAPGEPKENQ